MALQFSQGAPSDATGANGDYNLDTQGRFFYGPKASGSWSGVPLYALQGPSGPGMVYGLGAPASSQGAVGQGYQDLVSGDTWGPKTAGGWGSVRSGSIVGPQGIAGPSGQSVPSLASTSLSMGPVACNAAALALSGTLQPVPAPGTTQPSYFVPQANTVLQAAMFVLSSLNSPGATTFYLLDATAGQYRYSYTVNSFGTVTNQTGLGVALTAGNVHQWMVSGSGNGYVQVIPTFSCPSSQPFGYSSTPTFGNTLTTAPTSVTAFSVPGNTLSVTAYLPITKTAFLYTATFINTAASNATFFLYNSAGASVFSQVVSSGQNTPATVGPYGPSTAVLPAGYYTWRVQCSSAGYFSVQAQLFQ